MFVPSGIMERGNLSAAAGFGFDHNKFGVFSTFSAFLEMTISEITMARLNDCNLLCHFSHSGGRCAALFIWYEAEKRSCSRRGLFSYIHVIRLLMTDAFRLLVDGEKHFKLRSTLF